MSSLLIINRSDELTVELHSDSDGFDLIDTRTSQNKRKQVEDLPVLVSSLKNVSQEIEDPISQVLVNVDDAKWTALRTGIAFARGFARGLGVRVQGYKTTTDGQPDLKNFVPAFPEYESGANVVANVPAPIVNLNSVSTSSPNDSFLKIAKNKINVRKLENFPPEVLDVFYQLEKTLFIRDAWSEESLQACFDSGLYRYYVVEVDGEIVGASYLKQSDSNIFDIDSVGIHPNFQSLKLGEKLLRYVTLDAEQIWLESGASRSENLMVNLDVRTSNTRAISLYKKLGFEEVRFTKNFYQNPLDDAYEMLYQIEAHRNNEQKLNTQLILGFESSCDETGCGLVSNHQILGESLATSLQQHVEYGGVIPEIAARMHLEVADSVLDDTLEQAGVKLEQIDAISVTAFPGLVGCLAIGASYAKGLALGANKPIFGVNHIIGHLLASELDASKTAPKRLPEQFLGLIVSGGHSSLILRKNATEFVELGGTIDDAAGEAFDKVGRLLGLNYPAGPEIDRLAKLGNKDALQFPRPLVGAKFEENHKYDFSFSGLKTAAVRELERQARLPQEQRESLEDFCASFAETVADVLTLKTMKAVKEFGVKTVVIGGGFSANTQLRDKLGSACKKDGIHFVCPPIKYCTDNGSMIANLGELLFENDVPESNIAFGVQSVSNGCSTTI
jgi:N6-L-threonylcarbamoyladenine synthase